MTDGRDADLFSKFSNVAQRIGVYTTNDYADIIATLVKEWEVETIQGLSDAAAKAQDYLCTLSARYHKLSERLKITGNAKFGWIFDREIVLDTPKIQLAYT